MDSALIVFTKTPYGHINTIEAARIGQGLFAFDFEISVIFIDDGVFALLKNQNPEEIFMQPVKLTLEGLKKLDIEFYVVKESMEERGLSEEMFDEYSNFKIITLDEFSELQDKFDTTIYF
jgi:tRNA 2-thiouridine synthesizing protein C